MAEISSQDTVIRDSSRYHWRRLGHPIDKNGASWQKPRKADEAYGMVKDLILTGELAPGAMLDERHLIELLDVGRTPLREAIQRLAHEGLVAIAPRKGSWVTDLSISDLQELIAARELVESAVAASAVARITPEEIGHLRGLIDEVSEAYRDGDLLASIQADRAFHRSIALIGGNSYLARIVDDINTSTLRYWHLSFKHAGDLTETYSHHHKIIDRLEAGDAEGVRQAMLDHIDIFRTRMQQVLGSGT